jgi:hypothetical protein
MMLVVPAAASFPAVTIAVMIAVKGMPVPIIRIGICIARIDARAITGIRILSIHCAAITIAVFDFAPTGQNQCRGHRRDDRRPFGDDQ